MKHDVLCAGCGKKERLELIKGKRIPKGWGYWGKVNVNACKTDKVYYRMTDSKEPWVKVPNECYDPSIKPKHVEFWMCAECEASDDENSQK